MPVSTEQRPVAHRQIDFLSKQFLTRDRHSLSKPDGITNEALSQYQIHLIPFDFETLEDKDVNLSMKPPILFHPLPLSVLQKHPIRPELLGDARAQAAHMTYRNYASSRENQPPRNDIEAHVQGLRSEDGAREAHRFLYGWASRFPRSGKTNLHDSLQLRPIHIPNPFLLSVIPDDNRPPAYTNWSCEPLFESEPENENNVPANSHVILMAIISSDGKEDSIQIGELTSIIAIMHNRLVQPITYGEEDEENLFETQEHNVKKSREQISLRPRAFEKEERFPVLMVSLLGPQHGRLLYACMDGENLVIRQSKLYSFERKNAAPWDFFSRFILSRPLKESA